MRFVIKKLLVENFRCFEHLKTDLWDRTVVRGENESGKSCLASAILWALSGKDVEGNSSFEIVPTGHYGEASPSVTLECKIDEKPLTLKREYLAKYTRDKKFSSYVTVCYINGLEVGVKKFDSYISEHICDEEIFKILSNPYTFIENCPKETKEPMWQAQRRLLMGLVSSESDIDIATSNDNFKELAEPLNRFTDSSEYLSYLKQEKSNCTKNISAFESKLTQQEENIIEVSMTEKETTAVMNDLTAQMETLENQNNEHKQSVGIEKINTIKKEILNLKNERQKLLDDYKEKLDDYNKEVESILAKSRVAKQEADKYIGKQAQFATEVERIKQSKTDTICEACHRPLPVHMINEVEKAKQERIATGNAYIEKARLLAQQKSEEYQSLVAEAENLSEPIYPLIEKDIEEKIDTLMESLGSIQSVENIAGYEEKKEELSKAIESTRQILYNIKHNADCEEKIRALEQENRENNLKLNEIEKAIDKCKAFISFKCEQSESKINELFPNVKFRLFEVNKTNDDIREVCDMTFNGHKYADLSQSTKLIVNLELLSAFQKHYDSYIPIICDNCESVTADIENSAQVIQMYVKEELCPTCGGKAGRRQQNGLWKCQKCGHEWAKKLEIKEK